MASPPLSSVAGKVNCIAISSMPRWFIRSISVKRSSTRRSDRKRRSRVPHEPLRRNAMSQPAIARGTALLEDPALNKGTAFTLEERAALALDGLLPPVVETLEQQSRRCYVAFGAKQDDLERHIYLRALQDTNEALFYRLLLDHTEEMLPIVYTPVVARACAEFSHIYRRPRGLFIAYPLRDRIRELLANRPRSQVD